MTTTNAPILVIGATGAQGGATANALLMTGQRVRALVRDPESASARTLGAKGAELVKGDLEDAATVAAAMTGAHGVFSVQGTDTQGTDSERRHGFTLVEAARKSGVQHLVHTSVCEAGRHTGFPRWGSGYWLQKYWTDKWDVEQAVRAAGFSFWTVLKPAFMMDNFAQPKARFMFPHLRQGKIITALRPERRMQLIAADDVGVFAAAAFANPAKFNRQNIDLAAEALTMDEVAGALSHALNKTVAASSVTPAEAISVGLFPGWVRSQEWTNEVGYRADLDALKTYDIPLTRFPQWIGRHASQIVIDQ